MTDFVQIGVFALNIGIAFGGGMLWQKVRGHDESLKIGRERMQSIDDKLDDVIVGLAKINGGN